MNFGPLRPLTDAPGVGDGGGLANERWGANRRMEDEAAAMTSHARDRGTLAGRSTLSAAASSGSASDENPLPTAPFRWTPQAGAIGPDRRLAAPATTRSGSACGRSRGANRKEESQNCARPTSCHVSSELASGLGQRPSFLTAFCPPSSVGFISLAGPCAAGRSWRTGVYRHPTAARRTRRGPAASARIHAARPAPLGRRPTCGCDRPAPSWSSRAARRWRSR